MSNIARELPGGGQLSNIAQRGAQRLASAQNAVSQQLSKENLSKTIETGLGGMKMTTFGSKVFSGIEKEGGAYIKQQAGRLESYAKDKAGNAWESAKDAFKAKDDNGIQMEEVGEVQTANPLDTITEEEASTLFKPEAPPATAEEFAGRADSLGSRMSNLQSRLDEATDPPPGRPTAPKPQAEDEAPELPDPATKPSPAELVEPETAVAGEEGGVASLASSEGGLITGGEALGAVLDATGIGAPLGLLIGTIAVTAGLKKRADIPLQSGDNGTGGGYSYQMGV